MTMIRLGNSRFFSPLIISLLLVLIDDVCISEASRLSITFYKEENFSGFSFTNDVETCQMVTATNGSTSRKSARVFVEGKVKDCVAAYTLPCCVGTPIEIQGAGKASLPEEIVSISPCGKDYKFVTPPERKKLVVNVLGNINRTTEQVFTDDSVAIYHGPMIHSSNTTWISPVLRKAWAHIVRNYYTAKKPGDRKLYGTFFSTTSKFDLASGHGTHLTCAADWRNLLFVRAHPENFEDKPVKSHGKCSACSTDPELEADDPPEPMPRKREVLYAILYDLASMVETSNYDTAASPSLDVWGRDGWRDIFIYDVLSAALAYRKEAEQWKRDRINEPSTRIRVEFPKGSKIYYLRDWFLPLYEQNKGSIVFGKYFKLIDANFPKAANELGGQQYSRRMNLGEFIHFWSGAAGKNLKELATNAFGWNDKLEKQFKKAQGDFSKFKY